MDVKSELQRRNPGIVPQRDIEKLQVLVDQRQAGIDVAAATKQSAITRISTLLPAEKASAQAALAQAQVDLDKTFVRAGVTGRVEQFALRLEPEGDAFDGRRLRLLCEVAVDGPYDVAGRAG